MANPQKVHKEKKIKDKSPFWKKKEKDHDSPMKSDQPTKKIERAQSREPKTKVIHIKKKRGGTGDMGP